MAPSHGLGVSERPSRCPSHPNHTTRSRTASHTGTARAGGWSTHPGKSAGHREAACSGRLSRSTRASDAVTPASRIEAFGIERGREENQPTSWPACRTAGGAWRVEQAGSAERPSVLRPGLGFMVVGFFNAL